MQYHHPFFPNYPPPPLPTRDSIIFEGLKILEQSKSDQPWVKNWIEKKKQLRSKKISLYDYRQRLIQHAHLLEQYEQALQDRKHELKSKIEQSNHFIYDCDLVRNIQQKIHQRKSKRARLRRQKFKKLNNSNDKIIEEQISNEKPLIEKIQDMNSILQTIELLKQLKNTRQERQKDNMNNNTNDELTEIQNICHSQLLEYKTEMKKESQSPHIELYNHLFKNQDQSFYESTNPDTQEFLQAHQNISNLIQTRQIWDQYSITNVSSLDNIIPSKWHEPQSPSDSNWAQYIFNKKE